MKIKGVTRPQIMEIADKLNFEFRDVRTEGRYTLGVLRMKYGMGKSYKTARPEALKFRKRGFSAISRGSEAFGGNGAVCFHGHERFMREIFALNPDAVIRTAKAAYLGLKDFEEKYQAVGWSNVGSMMFPISYSQTCDCDPDDGKLPSGVTFGTLHEDGSLTNVRVIRHEDIGRCKFRILVPTHYRADGSCKCDDPGERAMMILEWGYEKKDFEDIPLRKEERAWA